MFKHKIQTKKKTPTRYMFIPRAPAQIFVYTIKPLIFLPKPKHFLDPTFSKQKHTLFIVTYRAEKERAQYFGELTDIRGSVDHLANEKVYYDE